MTRTQCVAARFALSALVFGAAASTSTAAYGLPHFGVHRHPGVPQDGRVAVDLYNAGPNFRDIKVANGVYTVPSHGVLAIKAPAGTAIYTETTGALHKKGDLLFTIEGTMQQKTVTID